MRKAPLQVLRWSLVFMTAAWILAPAAEPARTVLVVRHAERAAGGMNADVGISAAGQCRAENLARLLADAGVKRIYVTEVVRTQQTAAPLAKKLNIRPEVVPSNNVDELVGKLRAEPPGGLALVVTHGATLPDIISRLGGGTVPPIGDDEYDRLLVVTLTGPNQASVVLLRYAGCGR